MREIYLGSQLVRVKASALALHFYEDEFKKDLFGDLVKMSRILGANDPEKIEIIPILRLIWAMAKASEYPKAFQSFESWLSTFEDLDLSDTAFMIAAVEEAAAGFFRTGDKGKKSEEKQ